MDNVTHSLTGLALARAGLNRFSPHATALLVLSANAPDMDIVALSRGSLPYFEAHRAYTHSILCLPFVAALTVAVIAAVFRRKLPWLNAWLLCCVGVASHLLLDWTNSYGIRLLLPFSSRWFHLDLNGLFDAVILVVLLLAAIWPLFSGLVASEIGDRRTGGRGLARFALVFFLLFDVGRAVLHSRVLAQLDARLYDGAAALQVAALPDAFTPFRWTGVVETASAYERFPMKVLEQSEPAEVERFFKPAPTPAYLSAKASEPFRYFLYFARFPVWSEEPVSAGGGPGKRLVVADLRFGTPATGSFRCVAIEDDQDRVLHAGFRVGPETERAWEAAETK